MKSLMIAAVAVAGIAGAAPAFAQDATSSEPTLMHPQPYASLGYTYLNPYGHDLGELQGRIGAKMSRYWGVEGELGGGVIGNHFSAGPADTRVNLHEGLQDSIYGVGYLPLMHDKIDLIGRVGYGQSQFVATPDARAEGDVSHHPQTVVSWNYGAGAQYNLTRKDGIRFDYTRRDFQAKGVDNPKDTDTYSVSFVRKF